MSSCEFVTTFSPAGYSVYGMAFVDTFVEHIDAPLTIYHESQPNVDFHKKLTWRNLDHDHDRKRFIEDHGNDQDKVGTARDPNSQSIRFCHKVFALTDAARKSDAEWLVWVDGDVVFHNKLTAGLADRIMPEDMDLSFLWRRGQAPYTECGFVAYRIASQPVQSLLDDMRHYYVSGEIFSRPKHDWHDSRCFDICRDRSNVPPHRWHDLSAGCHGWHPWPQSVLAEFSSHQKGPRRKSEAYGSICP